MLLWLLTAKPGFLKTLEESCILPLLESYLKNDSLSDIESQESFYRVLFDLCLSLVKREETAKVRSCHPTRFLTNCRCSAAPAGCWQVELDLRLLHRAGEERATCRQSHSLTIPSC